MRRNGKNDTRDDDDDDDDDDDAHRPVDGNVLRASRFSDDFVSPSGYARRLLIRRTNPFTWPLTTPRTRLENDRKAPFKKRLRATCMSTTVMNLR